jgi:hypothetical protein
MSWGSWPFWNSTIEGQHVRSALRFVGGGLEKHTKCGCKTTGTRACNLSVALVAVAPVGVALIVAMMTIPVAAALPVAVIASSVVSSGLAHLCCSVEAFGHCSRHVAVLGAFIVGVKGVGRQREKVPAVAEAERTRQVNSRG